MKRFALLVVLLASLGVAHGQSASGNLGGILLPSAIRTSTATISSGDRANDRWRGGHVIIDISTYTGGVFTPTIQGKDPISGKYYTILVGTARSTSTGSPFIMRVYPGATAGADVANDVLPRTWRFIMVGTTTPNAAYSVGFQLVQ